MKRFTMLFGLVLIAATLWAFIPSAALATVPPLINFQGILKDGSGNPVADASYSVTFSIYETPTGGAPLWTETQSVSTTDGLFTAILGSTTPIPDTAFKSPERWLGIAVSPDGEMPRQRLVSVGYAYRVNSVDSALGGNIKTKVSIGPGHTNTGTDAFVAGANNNARGAYSVVAGGGGPTDGDSNAALGDWSTVSGGVVNTASGLFSTVGGGIYNSANVYSATIGGGHSNTADTTYATVGGGQGNTASGAAATVGGGYGNNASQLHATVGGGIFNSAAGFAATISGGTSNTASGVASAIPGGAANIASGDYSFAAGRQAQSLHNGAFVWADNSVGTYSSTGPNQFLIRAAGGVGIGTNSPLYTLDVVSPINVVARLRSPDSHSYTLFEHTGLGARTWAIHTGAGGGSGKFAIADISGGGQNRLVINEIGNVGFSVLSPVHPLEMANGAHCSGFGTWNNASSRTYKTDIHPMKKKEYAEILEKLEELDVVRFRYKIDPRREHIGLIAEDVPEEISSEDRKAVPTADAIAFLMAALKAQQAQMEELKAKIRILESR